MNALTFNNVTLNPISQNDNQIWLTSKSLANALDYADVRSVTRIFNRNSDEFTDTMTQVVNLTTNNKNNELEYTQTRIFSLRGCHLIAMFARTKVAKQFRKWVLDILDKEVGEPIISNGKLSAEQTLPLRNAVNQLVSKSGLIYSDCYKMVHQRFNVEEIKDLTIEQIPQAVEYVHGLILKVEPKQEINHEMAEVIQDMQKIYNDTTDMAVLLIRSLNGINAKYQLVK